jgi:hypothetical protein
MLKSELLRAIQQEIYQHDFSTFVDNPRSIVQGGKVLLCRGVRRAKRNLKVKIGRSVRFDCGSLGVIRELCIFVAAVVSHSQGYATGDANNIARKLDILSWCAKF